jgi:hypothetical protein
VFDRQETMADLFKFERQTPFVKLFNALELVNLPVAGTQI